MQKDILDIFNRFAGKEVKVTETQRTFTFPPTKETPNPQTFVFDEVRPHKNDPVMAQMERLARIMQRRLCVWFPGTVGTADYDTGRVNVYVEKQPDGKYRVSKNFKMG